MPVELKVPAVGESITEVVIAEWLKAEGDAIQADEPVAVIETDKVTVELRAPAAGTVVKLMKRNGESAAVGEVIGYVEEAAGKPKKAEEGKEAKEGKKKEEKKPLSQPEVKEGAAALPEREPKTAPGPARFEHTAPSKKAAAAREARSPAPGGAGDLAPTARVGAPAGAATLAEEEVVPMTPLRRRVAERLVEAQRTAALLTTFNEVDMSEVMALRQEYQKPFQERYEVKLGFMSFFVKAVIEALKLVPQLNAEIREGNIVFRNYYDIGIAVGGGRGLVVPVLRKAERMSFAAIESAIRDFAARAQENKLELEDLTGGTFTISNGGVYGSLLSTPIVNPPQSGILGLHVIQERPVARAGQVVIRPMMYIALTYDHRIVDGREAVTFLKRVKELVEEPSRILLEA